MSIRTTIGQQRKWQFHSFEFQILVRNWMFEPEDHWSCIAHLIAEDMLKSAVIEEKTFKHSPWAGADNPLGPKF